MKLLRSLCMALTMYSRIPAPRVEWKDENMAYAMCFFPVIGAFIALFTMLWLYVSSVVHFGTVLTAAVASLIPLAVSGGIHMDGFCDTADALGSNASRERMLEIMKDSRAGVSAVVSCAAYTLVAFALWTQVDISSHALIALLCVPVLTRALSAFAVVTFKSATGKGLLASFKNASDTTVVRIVCALWTLVCIGFMVWRAPLEGGFAAAAAIAVFIVYRVMSYRRFGGTTGDVAGWFVETAQLAALAAFVTGSALGGII